MNSFLDQVKHLIAKITLTKERFMGMRINKIEIYIAPSLKIIHINTKPESLIDSIGLEKKSKLDLEKLKLWAQEHDYDITFESQYPRLKRHLFSIFGDVMKADDTLSESLRKKTIHIIINEEELPDNIKEWAYNNPEKFLQNIQRIRDILKD